MLLLMRGSGRQRAALQCGGAEGVDQRTAQHSHRSAPQCTTPHHSTLQHTTAQPSTSHCSIPQRTTAHHSPALPPTQHQAHRLSWARWSSKPRCCAAHSNQLPTAMSSSLNRWPPRLAAYAVPAPHGTAAAAPQSTVREALPPAACVTEALRPLQPPGLRAERRRLPQLGACCACQWHNNKALTHPLPLPLPGQLTAHSQPRAPKQGSDQLATPPG
jgi:hypothetical protein